MLTKLCRKCDNKRPLEYFHFRSVSKGTRCSSCRICKSKYARKHYEDHKRDYIRKAKKWNKTNRQTTRELAYNYLCVHPCTDCGESNPVVLTFDHIVGKKDDDVSNMIRMGKKWDHIKTEIEKCEVRCANCHMHKTSKERKWWKAIAFARKELHKKS